MLKGSETYVGMDDIEVAPKPLVCLFYFYFCGFNQLINFYRIRL